MYLLSVDKNISYQEMKSIFSKVNLLLDPFNEKKVDFPISYDNGLNIATLIEGVEIYIKGKVIKLLNDYGCIESIDNYYVIQQWQ